MRSDMMPSACNVEKTPDECLRDDLQAALEKYELGSNLPPPRRLAGYLMSCIDALDRANTISD
jgi:hypothetical protein